MRYLVYFEKDDLRHYVLDYHTVTDRHTGVTFYPEGATTHKDLAMNFITEPRAVKFAKIFGEGYGVEKYEEE